MTKLSSIELEPLDDNWPIWSTRMEFALDRKGLWDVITAERITDENAEKDRKAKALIGQYVKDHLLFTVKRAASAREAWEALKELYAQRSVARKQELRIKLTNLRMLPEEDIARYVGRAQQLSADLRASGAEVKELELVKSILAGLPKEELLQDCTMIPYATSFVVFGDGVKKPVAGTGTAIIQTKQGTVTLKNVLHVPDACANLVSIGKAAEAGVNVTFHHGGCKLQSGTTVINVPKKNGVYMLTYSKEQRALTAMHQETAELWHQRYGHLSYSSLAQLVKKDIMVTGINLSKEETARLDTDEFRRKVCSGCIVGKQQRHVAKPHPGSEPAITEKLGLIHMDVCGPIEPTSMGGSRYIATFLDDYTNFSVVRLIKVKIQVPEEIKSVIAELERQTGLQVKAIRSDRGGEYINQTLQDYLKKKGIVQQLTAPYSPEQNGKAERLNRTLVERVRSMLHSSQVSKNLWAEAVVTANRIRNCSPTTGHTKTPWELFYNVKPDVSNMRIFGSIAYVQTPKELRKKLDPKEKPGIFLGYEPHAKAYRVLVDGKVKISKDVVVDESKFIL
ncbi:hypothetical protein CEUSTIGMA_g9814.t1 [Chlamydomonas eustigma]|uniref:Integrase catalytic domain-containing protein n=1 Tax=Chlamydomonas eustigma TaxID=1157962 RepID=A0A250XH92_9CHLO|nr:hypothetical protein CEUSTIGMA_g9814.t1 [Chlamydomonas eustigma]|eukprot:GAX82386.1 hypothetical protein CEUSTIGMA_g9814.t1 [Chlamydomonas eustigma]